MADLKTNWNNTDTFGPENLNEICAAINNKADKNAIPQISEENSALLYNSKEVKSIKLGTGLAGSYNNSTGELTIQLSQDFLNILTGNHKIIFNYPIQVEPKTGDENVKVTFTYRVAGDVEYYQNLVLYDNDEPTSLNNLPSTNSLTSIEYTIQGAFTSAHIFKLVGIIAESGETVDSRSITVTTSKSIWYGFIDRAHNTLPVTIEEFNTLIANNTLKSQVITEDMEIVNPSFEHGSQPYLIFIVADNGYTMWKQTDVNFMPMGLSKLSNVIDVNGIPYYYMYSLTDYNNNEYLDNLPVGDVWTIRLLKN